ncbi:LysR family transcriptional regulator [Pseudomonas sp. SZMC_28357]|uniref:LysR substrate-binding domain-containing protein n=1 Tax=Pseudomonas sp. SZMC_28357 TaxID=3074380 RepID=UPI0028727419|nr:LysR family transcriptional regulator [Pseudomonas sp. SZMC_28357]MDR9750573.1 LysR family transcriptional regulator [Pseudomonas sp. SZMC_28357]
MDRFDGMRAFVRVVEAGSFTKAAENLGISRTTVTQLVQQLEAHLRIKLLNRTTRKVNVTTDGAAYYERVVRLLADLEDIEGNLPGASTAPRGLLRVDVPAPFANILLVPALPGFFDRFPDIQLDLGASDRQVDLIGDNVDCVVRGGEVKDASLVARHVGDLQLGVYAAPSYLARAGTPLHPDELLEASHRIVRYRWDNPLPYTLYRGDERLNINGRHVLAIDDGNAYLTAGLAGLGVLWLPDYMAKAHAEQGALVRLFSDWRIEPMPLYVAYSPNRYVRKPLRVFIDWVVELLAEHAPRLPRS